MAAELAGVSTPEGAIKALLVEDDDLDAQILTVFANMDAGISVRLTRVHSLREALDLTRADTFDLYFVDLHVEGGTSLRLLCELESKGARAIVLSNASASEVRRYGLDCGGLRFLSKPDCSAARIGELMREVLAARAPALP